MYWCVGTEESAVSRESNMDPQHGNGATAFLPAQMGSGRRVIES